MKKLFSQPPFKARNKIQAKRSLLRQLRFSEYRRLKNKAEVGLNRSHRQFKRKFEDRFGEYVKVGAPENFSMIENAPGVIEFISRLRKCFDRKQKVFVVLENVKNISHDAIVVLLSIMVRFKAQKISFNGDFPKDKNASKELEQSGFFKSLYHQQFKDEDRYNILQERKNSIHTHAWKNVDATLSAKVIDEASGTVWNSKRRCQGVQRTLIELMLNTNNHATVGVEGDKHWWLSVTHRKSENRVAFSFVDYGVGVFTNLQNKPVGNKFYNAVGKLFTMFQFRSNAELLKLILEGELHQTATGKHYRGKGLPGIHDALKRNSISDLHIITNDVYADVSNNRFLKLKTNFSGTFIYWELKQNNISCDAIN